MIGPSRALGVGRAPRQLVWLLLCPLAAAAQSITFFGIGDLSGGDTLSEVRDATRVGGNIVAVGVSSQYAFGGNGDTPVKWVQGSGLSILPEPAGTSNSTTSGKFVAGRVIVSDGTVIGGSVHNSSTDQSRVPAVWTSSGATLTALGYLNGSATASNTNGLINGLSSDGSIGYGGTSYAGNGNMQMVRYASGTVTGLGYLNSGDNNSVAVAHAVSSDGTVALGFSYNTSNTKDVTGTYAGAQGFLYTNGYSGGVGTNSSMTALPMLASGGTWNSPIGMTAGTTNTTGQVFGFATSTGFSYGQLVRWNMGASITTDALGSPNTALTYVGLGAVTGDGSVVVSSWGDPTNASAENIAYFYNTHGWFNFQTAMSAAGVNLTGWTLTNIIGISSDGTLVYGSGNHNGNLEGWVISFSSNYLAGITAVPEPSSCAMFMGAAGLGAVISRRRRAARNLCTLGGV